MKKIIILALIIAIVTSSSAVFADMGISFFEPSYAQSDWTLSGADIGVNADSKSVSCATYEPRSAVYNGQIPTGDIVITADVNVHGSNDGNRIIIKAAGIDFAFDGKGNASALLGGETKSGKYAEDGTNSASVAVLYKKSGKINLFRLGDGDEHELLFTYTGTDIADKDDGKLEIDFSWTSGDVKNIKIYNYDDIKYNPSFYEKYTTTELTPYLKNFHLTSEENVENGVKGGEGYQLCYATAISDVNPDIMLRGFDTSGVYYSFDGGNTWKPAETSPECVLSLAFYPDSDKVCFALVGGEPQVSGIYKSTDAGVNWERVYAIGHRYVIRMCDIVFGRADKNGVHPMYFAVSANAAGLSALGDSAKAGVFKTTDMGQTFTNIGFSNYYINNIYADRDSDLVIVAVGVTKDAEGNAVLERGGLYVSRSGGASWEKSDKGLEDFGVYSVAVNPADKNIWVCTSDPRDPDDAYNKKTDKEYTRPAPMLYRSTDAGASWQKVDVNWQTEEQAAQGRTLSTHGACVVAHLYYTWPDENNEVALIANFDETVYPKRISYDGGNNFEIVNVDETNFHEKGSTGWYCDKPAFTRADPNLILWDLTISRDKGHNFVWNNSGISGFLCLNYYFDEKGIRFLAGYDMGRMIRAEGYSGVYPVMEYDKNINYHLLSTTAIAVDPNNPDHCFSTIGASTYGGESLMIESFDSFKTYTFHVGLSKRLQERTAEKGYMHSIGMIKYSPADPNVIYNSYFVSSDNGKTWRESEYVIKEISPFDADVAYTMNGSSLYITRDRAKTWQDTGIKMADIRVMKADLFEDYVVWAATHSGWGLALYRVDLKTGEVKVFGESNGLKRRGAKEFTLQINGLVQSPTDKNLLAVVTRDYYYAKYPVFVSYDGGETWHEVEGIPEKAGNMSIGISPTKPLIYLGGAQGVMVLDYEKYRELAPWEKGDNQ